MTWVPTGEWITGTGVNELTVSVLEMTRCHIRLGENHSNKAKEMGCVAQGSQHWCNTSCYHQWGGVSTDLLIMFWEVLGKKRVTSSARRWGSSHRASSSDELCGFKAEQCWGWLCAVNTEALLTDVRWLSEDAAVRRGGWISSPWRDTTDSIISRGIRSDSTSCPITDWSPLVWSCPSWRSLWRTDSHYRGCFKKWRVWCCLQLFNLHFAKKKKTNLVVVWDSQCYEMMRARQDEFLTMSHPHKRYKECDNCEVYYDRTQKAMYSFNINT